MTRTAVAVVGFVLAACSTDDPGPEADGPVDEVPVDPREIVVPEETADDEALAVMSSWTALPALGEGEYVQRGSEDLDPQEPPPTPLVARGNRDLNNFVCRSDDAEISDVQQVPFRYRLPECPEDHVRGVVLSRFEGSGRLTRFWMTTYSRFQQTLTEEMRLRVYVDGRRSPLIQVPVTAMMDGTAGEIFAPPFGASALNNAAWRYPVVFASKLVIALDGIGENDGIWHQTDVVLDREPRDRVRGSSRSSLRDAVGPAVADPASGAGDLADVTVTAQPDARTVVTRLDGPATIRSLDVEASAADLGTLADVTLVVTWDGAPTPAIDVPVLDLFAASRGVPSAAGVVLSAVENGPGTTLSLRLPMPFARSAEVALQSAAGTPVSLRFVLRGDREVPTVDFGRLHVLRRQTTGPTADSHHPIASVHGRGRLAGVCATMEGHAAPGVDPPLALHCLEGDERGLVDGSLAIPGTGTEDYFDSAFYFFAGPFANAFAQAWNLRFSTPDVPPRGLASACRWHVLGDTVDFRESLDFSLEIGPGTPEVLDEYRTVAFVYR